MPPYYTRPNSVVMVPEYASQGTQAVVPTDDSLAYNVNRRGPLIMHRNPFTGIAFEGHPDGSVSALTGYASRYPHVIRRTASGDPTMMFERYMPYYAPVQAPAQPAATAPAKPKAPATPKKPDAPKKEPEKKPEPGMFRGNGQPYTPPAPEQKQPAPAPKEAPAPAPIQTSHHRNNPPVYDQGIREIPFPQKQPQPNPSWNGDWVIKPPVAPAQPQVEQQGMQMQQSHTASPYGELSSSMSVPGHTPTPADAQLGRGVQYEQIGFDPSGLFMDYNDTFTQLLNAMDATGYDTRAIRAMQAQQQQAQQPSILAPSHQRQMRIPFQNLHPTW